MSKTDSTAKAPAKAAPEATAKSQLCDECGLYCAWINHMSVGNFCTRCAGRYQTEYEHKRSERRKQEYISAKYGSESTGAQPS